VGRGAGKVPGPSVAVQREILPVTSDLQITAEILPAV